MGPPGPPGAPAAGPVFAAPMMMMRGGGGGKGYFGDEPEAVIANHEFYRMYDGKSKGINNTSHCVIR